MDQTTIATYLQSALDRTRVVLRSAELIMAPEATEAAFGAPGQSGEAKHIRVLASRLNAMCSSMMDGAAEARGVVRPQRYEALLEALASISDRPIQCYREWLEQAVADLDTVPASLARNEPPSFSLALVLDEDDQAIEDLMREADRVIGR